MSLTSFDYDLFIVGAFGRGQKLALAARKLGLKTAFLDLTHQLGAWSCEDFEGPFGTLGLEEYPDWRIRLSSDGQLHEQEVGLCIWRREGPFEFKGPLASYHLRHQHVARRQHQAARADVNHEFFEDYWLRYLDLCWGATREVSFHEAIRVAQQTANQQSASANAKATALAQTSSSPTENFLLPPFLTPRLRKTFSRRWLNLSAYENGLLRLREEGVQVSFTSRLKDVALGGAQDPFFGIETTGEWVGLTKARAGAWLLSSEETYFLSDSAGRALYPQGAVEPECCWLRYEFQLLTSELGRKFPQHFVILNDVNQFWMGDNFLIVQKALLPDVWDVWVKIPFVQRFNSDYLREVSDRISVRFGERIGADRMALREMPREFQFTYQQLGPARFPVFRENTQLAQKVHKTVLRSGPDHWAHYDWSDRARSEGDELATLTQMIQRRKDKGSDRTLHAP